MKCSVTHFREVALWRNHRMWLIGIESLASLIWITASRRHPASSRCSRSRSAVARSFSGFGLGWGIAIAVVAVVQLIVALVIDRSYDPTAWRALLIGAIYPVAYWLIAGVASLHSQTIALVRGPQKERVIWDSTRDQLEVGAPER